MMANLCESDQNLIFVGPKYLPIVQRIRPKTALVENWSAEAITRRQCAFECTDWNVFLESAVNVNELVETVVQYIQFAWIVASQQSVEKSTPTTSRGLLNTSK